MMPPVLLVLLGIAVLMMLCAVYQLATADRRERKSAAGITKRILMEDYADVYMEQLLYRDVAEGARDMSKYPDLQLAIKVKRYKKTLGQK